MAGSEQASDEIVRNEINRRLKEARSRPECGVEFWLEKGRFNLDVPQPRADTEWFPRDPTTLDFLNMDQREQVAYLDGLRVGAEWWRSSTPCWGAPNPNGGSPAERDSFTPIEIVWGLLKDLSMLDEDLAEEWLARDAKVRIYETCQKGHPEDRRVEERDQDVVRLEVIEAVPVQGRYFGMSPNGDLVFTPEEARESRNEDEFARSMGFEWGLGDLDGRRWMNRDERTEDGVRIWYVFDADGALDFKVAVRSLLNAKGDRILMGARDDDGRLVAYMFQMKR